MNPDMDYQWTKVFPVNGGIADIACTDSIISVCGSYAGTADFDPGPGIDEHSTNLNSADCFLTKLDIEGNYIDTVTWGGSSISFMTDMEINVDGSMLLTGAFHDDIDLDPGPAEDMHYTSEMRIFVSKLSTNGLYQWGRSWGDSHYNYCRGVTSDTNGYIYCVGEISRNTDLDPGPGEDIKDPAGIFLSKLDSSGNYLWGHSWGVYGYGVSVKTDLNDDVFITGDFSGRDIDMDPGPGHVLRDSIDFSKDAFVEKFNSDGSFNSVITWGGPGWDLGNDLEIDNFGNLYVTGVYYPDSDLDPGSDIVFADSMGFHISKFNHELNLEYCRFFDCTIPSSIEGIELALNESGEMAFTASFRDMVDLRPGHGDDDHFAYSWTDVFLVKLNEEGLWE